MNLKHIIIIIFLTIILLFGLFVSFNPTNFNPFKNKIKIPNILVENFIGDTLDLDSNTNKKNPMKKLITKNKITHKNLVFTSAGNNTNFHKLWIGPDKNYDIMVVYYGNDEKMFKNYESKVDYIMKRKGSKFQNFHYVYNNHLDIINKYDRFFILDDDIIFNVNDINEMFHLSQKYNFWICGPTFKNVKECKLSHHITISKPNTLFRYTNFIEVNVPLFNRYALDMLMKHFDPILIGWGIDFLYIWACGNDKKDKYALIDKVTCINPHDNKKNNKRELNNIKNVHNRKEIWEKFKKKYKIKINENKFITWKKIPL